MNTTAKVVTLPTRLECSACGMAMTAACDCHAAYVPAGTRAAEAVAKNPEKSDRAIAAELGVSHTTVQKVRKSTGNLLPVEPRVGLDGKTRRLPTAKVKKPPTVVEAEWPPKQDPKVQAFLRELGDFMGDFCWHLEEWIDTGPVIDTEAQYALVENLSKHSMRLQMLAQKIDGR